MSVNRYLMPVVIITALFGTIVGSQIFGWWSVSGRASVDMGELAPEDIKGWMTVQQVADGLGLPVADIYRIGGIPADVSPDTALKDMEDIVEVSTMRTLTADYLANGEAAAPEPEVEVPAVEPTAAPTVAPEATVAHTGSGDGTGPTQLPPGQTLPADQIKGRMTLREVSDQCAVDLTALLDALNLPPDTDPDTQLKTLISDGTLDEVTQVQHAAAVLQAQ